MSPEVDGDLVSAAVVDETIDALCELRREHAIAYSIDVGRVIVERMYGGDLDRLRARRDKSSLSLRALAGHPRMPLSATALHHAVGVYMLVARVPGLLDTELTLTHMRAVLSLSEEAQDQLLSRAVAEGWTSRR